MPLLMRLLLSLLLALGLLLPRTMSGPLPAAHAAGTTTWTVTGTGDDSSAASCTPGGTPGTGSCGTLRDALAAAAADSPAVDTIDLTHLSGTIVTTFGTLEVASSVTIEGPGAATLAVSGNDDHTVFLVESGTTVTISGLTVQNGWTAGEGGGIVSAGTLTLTEMTISDNMAGYGGGGIYSDGRNHGSASLSVTASAIANNTAIYGGGIYSNGYNGIAALTVTDTTIVSNTATYGFGGGIYSDGSQGTATVTLTASTLSGNTAYVGGGLYAQGFSGTLLVTATNTLLAGNLAAGNCALFPTPTLADQGGNLDDDGSCGFSTPTSISGATNPGLGTLGSYGGPTQTINLLPGSQALGLGVPAGCLANGGLDQRGVARPATGCDSGAFQAQLPITPPAPLTGTFGSPYLSTTPISMTGGTAPITYTLVPDTLTSTGLTLDAHSGVISGTPSTAGTIPLTITATDGVGDVGITATTSLLISAAGTSTTASAASTTYSLSAQAVTLAATVTCASPCAVPVNAGSVTFTLLQGTTVIGIPVTSGTVNGGTASVSFSLPAGTAPGSYTIAAVYSGSATFSGSADSSHSLTVSPATATLAFAPGTLSQSYGSTAPVSVTTSPLGLSVVTGIYTPALLLTSTTIPPTQAGSYQVGAVLVNPDYQAVPITGTLVIATVPLTITASSARMSYGGTVPPITPSYAGFVGTDSAAALTTLPTCGTTATSASPAGSDATSCSGAVDANYAISYQAGTLSVGRAATSLQLAASPSSLQVGQTLAVTATISPTLPTIPTGTIVFTLTSSLGSVITLTSTLVGDQALTGFSGLPAGQRYTLQAGYLGNQNFLPSSTTRSGAIGQLGCVVRGEVAQRGVGMLAGYARTPSSSSGLLVLQLDTTIDVTPVQVLACSTGGRVQTALLSGTVQAPSRRSRLGSSRVFPVGTVLTMRLVRRADGAASAVIRGSDGRMVRLRMPARGPYRLTIGSLPG